IHRLTPGEYLGECRAAYMSATRSRKLRPNQGVIAVEKIIIGSAETPVTRREGHQQKFLEKPGGMRQVPLGRTDIRHALNDSVFRCKPGDQGERLRAHAMIIIGQTLVRRIDPGRGQVGTHASSLANSRLAFTPAMRKPRCNRPRRVSASSRP